MEQTQTPIERPVPKAKQIREDLIFQSKVIGRSTAETARLAGCSISTVERRMSQPDFWPKVYQLRDAALQEASGRLNSVAVSAVTALEELLKSESETLRLGAARAVLEHCCSLRKHISTEERLTALEQALVDRLTRVGFRGNARRLN